METAYGQLPVIEKVLTFIKFGQILLAGAFSSITYPFRSISCKEPTIGREAFRVLFKKTVTDLSPRQLQYLFPSGTSAYNIWMAKIAPKFATDIPTNPFTENLPDGGKLHWIGRRDARKVIFHMHSGGYALPLHDGHLNFSNYLRGEVLRRKQIPVKVAFLEYTLIPQAVYPTQFHQAITAVKHMISQGISPSDILIFGDSAGGMLAPQIISHALHSHPAMPSLHLSSPFAGFLLMSPWVELDCTTPSFDYNHDKDLIDRVCLLSWAEVIREGTKREGRTPESERNWLEPAKAPPEWWKGSDAIVRRMMVLYAGREVLKDCIVDFGNRFKEGTSGQKIEVTLLEDKEAVHIAPVVDALWGREPDDTAKVLSGWVAETLCP